MEQEILVGSNSDITVKRMIAMIRDNYANVVIKIIDHLESVEALPEGQLVILDLSVYTYGLLERINQFKHRFPQIELIAVTFNKDEIIDQMLLDRGIDQVADQDELPQMIRQYLNRRLQPTG